MSEPLRAVKEDSARVDLKDAGELPPPSDDEEVGRVHRDPEILSECPEIDTTRAEPPPKRLRKGFLVCVVLYCVGNVLSFLVTTAAAYYYGRNCDLNEVKALVRGANFTTTADVLLQTTRAYESLRAALTACARS